MNLVTPLSEKISRIVMAMPMAQTLKFKFLRIEVGIVELEIPIQ